MSAVGSVAQGGSWFIIRLKSEAFYSWNVLPFSLSKEAPCDSISCKCSAFQILSNMKFNGRYQLIYAFGSSTSMESSANNSIMPSTYTALNTFDWPRQPDNHPASIYHEHGQEHLPSTRVGFQEKRPRHRSSGESDGSHRGIKCLPAQDLRIVECRTLEGGSAPPHRKCRRFPL